MNITGLLESLDSSGFLLFRFMVSVLWQSSIVFCTVFFVTFMLRQNRAAVRHAVWIVALLMIPVIPLLSLILTSVGTPQAPLPVIPQYTVPESTTTAAPMYENIDMPELYNTNDIVYYDTHAGNVSPSEIHTPVDIQSESMPENSTLRRFHVLKYPWACLFVLYTLGVIFFLSVFMYGRIRIRRWKTGSRVLTDPDILDIFRKAAGLLNLKKEFIVAEHKNIEAPLTLGTLHTVILLPEGFSGTLSAFDLESIALHELAHVKRHDVFTLTCISLLRSVLFFHPLVWIAARMVTNLAELACDDTVLEKLGEPVSYAKMLTRIAERLPSRALQTELAAGFLISKSAFLRRVEAILSERRDHIRKLSRLALSGTVVMVVVSLLVAFVFPLGEKSKAGVKEAQISEEMGSGEDSDSDNLADAEQGISESGESIAFTTGTVDSEPVTVSGKVLFKGRPVSNAEVYLDSAREKVAETGSDGAFSFEMDNYRIQGSDTYRSYLVVYKPDYAVSIFTFYDDVDIINIEVNLAIGSRITGIVLDTDQYPIENARINVVLLHPFFYSMKIMDSDFPGLSTITGERGFFSLGNLPARTTMMLNIVADGYALKLITGIQPGSQNLRFFLEPEGVIQGKITVEQSREPVQGIVVRAKGATSGMPIADMTATTDSNGNYTIKNLSAGFYNVFIYDNPDWTVTTFKNEQVHANGITKDVNLTLTKGGYVTGRITEKDSGEPIAYHEIFLRDASRPDAQYYSHRTITDTMGFYRFRAAPGEATVYTRSPRGYMYESLQERRADVSEGKTVSKLNFEFVKGIEVAGFIHDSRGQPVGDAEITVKPAPVNGHPRFDSRSMSRSDKNGTFLISGFESGEELIIYAEHNEKKLRGESTFTFETGSVADITLDPYETADVQGRVLDPDGEFISGAEIKLSTEIKGEHAFKMWTASYTNAAGHYLVKDLIIGDEDLYAISAEAEGFENGSVELPKLNPGMNELENITLEPKKAGRWL
ncbi:MAG: carboxypeptidase regulatory-like domain-containing protein, partial [Candidatus Latescibacteria bacterium]|nr:carboxypeptidase regulatory-like domain-containing protein [Candidatus Latescibacterota bacterium]